jgi:hypothetical protein
MSDMTRRDLLATLIATATAAAVDPLLARAQPAETELAEARRTLSGEGFADFREFLRVSEALTGIDGDLLAPGREMTNGVPSGADPHQAVKLAYFELARANPAYSALLREFRDSAAEPAGGDASAAARKLLLSATDGVKELARSIIMSWYFGVWYEWRVSGGKPRFTVVSADAYTQGWIWRIAEAHPPGYSNLRFGHWAFPPPQSFDIANLKPKARQG